jgi:hypothetical protein
MTNLIFFDNFYYTLAKLFFEFYLGDKSGNKFAGTLKGITIGLICSVVIFLLNFNESIQEDPEYVFLHPSMMTLIILAIMCLIAWAIKDRVKEKGLYEEDVKHIFYNHLYFLVAIPGIFCILTLFLIPKAAEYKAYQNIEKMEKIFSKASVGELGVVNVPVEDLEEAEWMVKHLYCYKSPSGGKLRADSRLSFAKIVFGDKREYTFSIACGGRNDELHVFSYNKDKVLK